MSNRSPDMCLCFVEDAATSSSCCGGMATVSVCLPSVSSAVDSSGRRPRVELFISVAHSYLCFWKASSGGESNARGHQKSRSDDHHDSSVLMQVFHACTYSN